MAETKPIPNQKLRYERERRGWSQQDVADQVGTTPLNVGRWERGVNIPGPYFRQKLSEVFEKTLQELGLAPANTDAEKAIETPSSPSVMPAAQDVPASVWNVPYNRNLLFTGREDILSQLREALTGEDQPVALAQPQAISGLGGIGKTQTAVEYAYRYRQSYDAVLWARADSADLLSSDFLTIAALLNLPQRNEQDQSLVVKAVLNWFDSHENWLLILDNADQLETVSEFIPSAGKGHVLLTTRANSTGTIAQRLEIEKMGTDEGIVLLLRRMKRLKGTAELESVAESMRKQAQAIVEALDGLPLALDQAGAYIEETGCSLSDYLKFYQSRRKRLLRTRGQSATGHPEPVATTWSLAFEKVQAANPAAAELLRLCAFLHPDEIPEAMFIEGAAELGPLLQPMAEDEMELNEAIGELRKYSLLKRDPEKKILNMHRLVQAVIKDGMSENEQRQWAERVVRMVNKAFPEVKFEVWPTCQWYLPHAQICATLIEQREIELPEAARLLNQAGYYLQERGQFSKAELFYQPALIIRERVLGLEHPDVGRSLNNLGKLYREQGKYFQGEPLFLRALEIMEKSFGSEHLEVAFILENLGELYRLQSQYMKAESFYQHTLAIREQHLGVEHIDVGTSVNNLALFYHYQGNYAQAEPLYLRALTIHENVLGPEHPEVATVLNNLAALYDEQGKSLQAVPLFMRAIAIREQSLGFDHPYLAYCLNNLGALYHDRGEYTQAEPLLLRALAIREQALGPLHPEVASSLGRLALLYKNQGKYPEAEELYQRSLTIREQVLGLDHPDIARGLSRLAELYNLQGKYNQAEPLLQRALAIYDKTPNLAHPDVAIHLKNFASIYHHHGNYEQAELLYRRALAIEEQSLGYEHPKVAATLIDYASLLQETNRPAEAAELEARAQAIRAKQE